MTAKDFIKNELIDEIGAIVNDHPYIVCIVMSCGIEFLGKCMDMEDFDYPCIGMSIYHDLPNDTRISVS